MLFFFLTTFFSFFLKFRTTKISQNQNHSNRLSFTHNIWIPFYWFFYVYFRLNLNLDDAAPNNDIDENESEDEGIEDYKLGGYHPVHIGFISK